MPLFDMIASGPGRRQTSGRKPSLISPGIAMPGVDPPIHVAPAARTARPMPIASCNGMPSATVTTSLIPASNASRTAARVSPGGAIATVAIAPVAATAAAQSGKTGTPAASAMSVRVEVPPTMLVP